MLRCGARRAGKSFFSGLLAGLSAATLVHEHTRRPRLYSGDGLRGDWQAIGDELRQAPLLNLLKLLKVPTTDRDEEEE